MTREQLIEAMARAMCTTDEQNGGPPWDYSVAKNPRWIAAYFEKARDLFTAIEAAGLCIVPRKATEAMIENGGSAHIYPSVYMGGVPERAKIHANSIYRAMIDAGKL